MTMRRKHRLISVRNMIIMFLIIILVFFSVEKYLSFVASKEQKSNNFQISAEEDLKIRYFNLRKTPLENMNCAEQFKFYFTANKLNEFLPQDSDGYKTYPLINLSENIDYDENTFNIIVIGDSFVWGDGYTNRNELFWRKLETMLREKNINVRVYGVGLCASNAYDELSWLMDTSLVADLSPDIVIFGYVENDSDSRTAMFRQVPVIWEEKLPVIGKLQSVFPFSFDKLTERLKIKTMYNDKYGDLWSDNDVPAVKGKRYTQYKENFADRLNDFSKTVDFPIIVMTLPRRPDTYLFKQLYKPLREIYSDTDNIYFYDSLSAFSEFDRKQHRPYYAISAMNDHPGTATAYFYAKYICDFLENDFELTQTPGFKYEKQFVLNECSPGNIGLRECEVNGDSIIYTFEYPSETDGYKSQYYNYNNFLSFPVGEDYIQLSFSEPVDMSEIRLRCDAANDVKIWYTAINSELGYDDNILHELQKNAASGFVFTGNLKNITSVCLHIDTEVNTSAKAEIEFVK